MLMFISLMENAIDSLSKTWCLDIYKHFKHLEIIRTKNGDITHHFWCKMYIVSSPCIDRIIVLTNVAA